MGRTNIVLDDALLEEGLRLSGGGTRRALVQAALERYVAWLRQQRIQTLRGQVNFDPGYDHKPGRASRAAEPEGPEGPTSPQRSSPMPNTTTPRRRRRPKP